MYCPKCGAENAEGIQTCQSCSGVLEWSDSQATTGPPKTSGLAITSFILGILSVFTCFITAIPGVILGIISVVKISKSNGRQKGIGLAITGIAMPVVLIPVFAILLAIMMPALGNVKHLAMRLVCGTNMKGLAIAISVYSMDYEGAYPTGSQWCDLLIEEADVGSQSLICPGADMSQCNYALNANALRLGKDAPSDMVLMFECAPGWNQTGGPELLTTDNHLGEGCNVMHVDGFVEFVKTEDLNRLRWTVDEFEEPQYNF